MARVSVDAPRSEPELRESHEVEGTRLEAGSRRRGPVRLRSRRRRLALKVGLAVVTVVALTAGVSLFRALRAPGGDPTGLKLVEWVRDHGGGGVATSLENWWYTSHPPRVGGRPSHGIPRVNVPTAPGQAVPQTPNTTASPRANAPADVRPLATPALTGEGVWQPTGKLVGGTPGVYQTFLRPDPIHTSVLAGLVWMDTSRLRAVLYNGLQVPGGGPWAAGAHVVPADYPGLVAAFNGAFRLDGSRGGYFTEGRTVQGLVAGRASLVITRDGRVTVAQWGRDATMSPNVVSVRQNLDLIVDGGQPVPGLVANDHSRWGATVGGAVYVWRSGLGVDRNGNLIYAAGPGLSITSLANLLADAGSVRGMELDINSEWVSSYTYSGTTAADIEGHKLLGSIQRPNDRYLHDGTRDFIAMFGR